MAKHARKRQKTAKDAQEKSQRNEKLELLMDDSAKDDEERRLESLLFGTKFAPRDDLQRTGVIVLSDDDEEENMEEGGREMEHLMDHDLFFVDDGVAAPPILSQIDLEQTGSDDQRLDLDRSDETEDSDDDASSSSAQSQKHPPNSLLSRKTKPPAWVDPSDRQPTISLLSGPSRLRKLRETLDEDVISSKEYETRLRRQFERINPEPAWAKKARRNKGKSAEGDDEDEDNDDNLFTSTGGIMSRAKSSVLPVGTLAIERLRDANQAVQGSGSGEVRVVAFHPSDKVPVLCVATADRRVRLFNIDGHTSPLMSTLHVPSLPFTTSTSVSFHPQGSSLLLAGPRPFFFTHDLQTGETTCHARGLWGTTFNGVNDTSFSLKRGRNKGEKDGASGEGLSLSAFSPHTGDLLAVAGRGGYVHLVDWKSGAGQVVGSLKCSGGGGVQGLWWVPPGSGSEGVLGSEGNANGGGHLAVLSGDAEVYLWDVGQRRCLRRWKDEGGFRGAGRVLAGTTAGGAAGWLAIGSNTGFVNVYGADSFAPPSTTTSEKQPKPLKTLPHLTTAISSLRFNHDAQLLAVASKEKKDSMRLIHLPSLTSFANWPTSSTALGHVTAVDFSAGSEYVAVGNTRGRVLLYHLKDYGASMLDR